jgi:protein disulfide-isomerase
MKRSVKILLSAAMVLTATAMFAAPHSKAKPAPRADRGEPYRIVNDYREAQRISARTRKPIMIIFSGSDWCDWCVKLDNEVFSRREFQNWAKDHLVVYLADFPRRKRIAPAQKEQNDMLARKYRVNGFPTVLIVNAKGDVIARTGYRKGGPAKYVQHLKQFVR